MPGGSPRASLVPLNMRGIPYADQAPRREAFERAHPEVTITPGSVPLASAWDRASWWQAAMPDGDSVEYVTRYELSDLLDVLEERFPPEASPP